MRLLRAITVLPLVLAACGDTSGPIRTISFAPCGLTTTYLAYQPKGEAWSQVTSEGGVFSFRIPEQVGIAFTTSSVGGGPTAYFYFMTADELLEFAARGCLEGTVKQLTGSVASVPSGNTVLVTIGNGSATVNPANSTDFQLLHTKDGVVDVVATTQTVSPGQTLANRIIIRRGLSLPSGSAVGTLSFSGTEPQDVTNGSVTIAGVNSGENAVFSERYYTIERTNHVLASASGVTNGTRTNVTIPGGTTVAGDFYIHTLFVTTASEMRSTTRFDEAPGNHTLTLGPSLQTPTFTTLSTAPFGRIRMSLPTQAEYASFAHVRLTQNAPPSSGFAGTIHQASILVSSGYLGASPGTWTLEIPDLSQIPGYPAAATFSLPSNISWTASAHAGPIAAFFGNERITSGTVFNAAQRTGSTVIQ